MRRYTFIFSMLLLFLFGCSSGNENTANTNVEEGEVEVEKEELEFKFDVNITNNQAEFMITLTNHSNEMKKLEFPTSQKYEIIVTDENQKEVYRFSKGKMFIQAIEYALIKQDESIVWEELWVFENEGMKPGKYEVEVSILAHNADNLIKKKSVQITE